MKGGQVAGALPMLLLTNSGSLSQHASKEDKKELAKEHDKLRRYFGREHDVYPKKIRKPTDFSPLEAHAILDQDAIAVSPRSSSSIMAHELGHVSNFAQGSKTLPGKVHQGLTSLSYSPLYPGSSIIGSLGYVASDHLGLSDLESLGHAGTATAGILGLLQLMEEGRASLKARKAIKALRGDQYRTKDVAPLIGGFGTYALGLGGAVGFPLLLNNLT